MLCVVDCFAAVHHAEVFLKRVQGRADEGAQIVEHYCAVCHAEKPQIMVGAPRILKAQDWLPRLQKGLKSVLKHTQNGYNAMPPRGGCFECSDEQLQKAVFEMIPHALIK